MARPLLLLLFLSACTRGPSEAQLTAWLDETHREEQARRSKSVASEVASWTLAVRGNVKDGAVDYQWPKIQAGATTHLQTSNPGHTADVKAVLDYRGLSMSGLLDGVQAKEDEGPGGKDVTIVAADGFMHTVPMADLRRFPFLLAVEENGVALAKKNGGPLLEIVPHTSHPETKKLWPEGGSFYVTTMIVGTEKLALRVGGKLLGEKDLAALPEAVVLGKPGFRFRWPSGEVSIQGVRLRDVLRAATVPLRSADKILVRRKPRTEVRRREVTTLSGHDVLACNILIGLRYGPDRAPIPAALGGPVVLAFPRSCPGAAAGQPWPMFVESIEVVPAAGRARVATGSAR